MNKKDINPAEVCNINVGVMGHVDSGKTSLGRLLIVWMNCSEVIECDSVNGISR